MSTVSTSQPPPPQPPLPDESDPFRYGSRYLSIMHPDGTEGLEQVPLTLEDALHSEPGDHIVHSDPHDTDLNYLKNVFKSLLAHDSHAFVLSDCGVDWNLPGVKPVCPDISVFFGVEEYGGWTIFDVAAEHANPALVVEVTSPSTRSNDVGIKVNYYHRAGVPIYIIADARYENTGNRRLALTGYRHTPKSYEKIPVDPHGRIWLEAIGVWLGISQDRLTGFDRLACFNAETNEEIGDYTAITRAFANEMELRIEAEAQAKEARARATAAEARIRELEAALNKQSSPDS